MLAFEFEADIHNGMVKIPNAYQKKLTRHVKITIQSEDTNDAQNISDEYIELHWRELLMTSNMGGDYEKSEGFHQERSLYLAEKYK